MVDFQQYVSLLVLGSILLAGAPPAEGTDGVDDAVATPWPIDVTGVTMAQSAAGALSVEDAVAVTASRLRAEAVEIRQAWEKGVDVRDDDSIANVVEGRGADTIHLGEATVGFSSTRREATMLAYSETDAAVFASASAQGATVARVQDPQLAAYGTSSDSVNAGETQDLGFWYAVERATIVTQTAGTVTVTGDFTLFVHEVNIEAKGADTTWSNWTGYRENDPDGRVTGYEFRITVLEITNGTLTTMSAEPLGLYSRSLVMDIDGLATGQAVSGQIRTGNTLHVFDTDPLRLEGTGRSFFQVGAGDSLRMAPKGDFAVQGASSSTTTRGPAVPLPSGTTWGAVVGLASISTLGLMFLGVVPGPTPRSRRKRHARWMHKGQAAEQAGAWIRAASFYRRAVRIRRDDPLAWYQWASCTLEGGDPAAAERLASRASGVPGMDVADLLDLRAMAAWERGDKETFEGFVCELGDLSPSMAKGLLLDLGLDPSSFDAQLGNSLGAVDGDGGFAGYA